jgi:hypothetical protein
MDVQTIGSTSLKREEDASSRSWSVKKSLWSLAGTLAAYQLFDQGLANFLNLETLRHGTGPLGFVGINLHGADPNYGGHETGSGFVQSKYMENSKGYFHVFKDSECSAGGHLPFFLTIPPRIHAILSGTASIGVPPLGMLAGLLTPTLRFRFRPEDILGCIKDCQFEDDPDYDGAAYRTQQPISPIHLGITGSITQGVDSNMFSRMSADPLKVLGGALLLIGAYKVAKVTYNYFTQETSEQPEQEMSWVRKVAKKVEDWSLKAAIFAAICV